VYQENFDNKLTDDVDYKSLEKEGNCTVIKKANTVLMANYGMVKHGTGHLENVYSKEKCDDSVPTTSSNFIILTSHTR
jgi:hypothetical protein